MDRQTRIVIVEDHPAEIFLIGEAVRHAKWNAIVERSQSGDSMAAALRQISSRSPLPDLFILDCLLHGETSFETIRAIRGHQNLRCQPIVVFSSRKPRAAADGECRHLDALMVLEKPRDYPGLVKMVKQLESHVVAANGRTPLPSRLGAPSSGSGDAPSDMQLGNFHGF